MFASHFGKICPSRFQPPAWAGNAHIQTIYPKFFSRTPKVSFTRKRIDTPDGDFLDLGVLLPPRSFEKDEKGQPKPKSIAVLFHGLEGSENSHYIQHLSYTLAQSNIASIVMHFRGCSGEINKRPRAYHSGETSDALYTLLWVSENYPQASLFTVGFSLGGNMLLNLLARHKVELAKLNIAAAVSVCAPIHLKASSEAINKGFARRYQSHLLATMKTNLLEKMQHIDMSPHLKLTPSDVRKLTSFYEFDEHITSRLHGFDGADDYYQKCSALPILKDIQTPTLILHAADDPFMDARVIPKQADLSPSLAYELSAKGGHVGFMQSRNGGEALDAMFLPKRILQFATQMGLATHPLK